MDSMTTLAESPSLNTIQRVRRWVCTVKGPKSHSLSHHYSVMPYSSRRKCSPNLHSHSHKTVRIPYRWIMSIQLLLIWSTYNAFFFDFSDLRWYLVIGCSRLIFREDAPSSGILVSGVTSSWSLLLRGVTEEASTVSSFRGFWMTLLVLLWTISLDCWKAASIRHILSSVTGRDCKETQQ